MLILSMYDNEQYFFEALKAGASGYVLKSVADRDLARGMPGDLARRALSVCRRGNRVDPGLPPSGPARRWVAGHHPPPREEVLKLIAEGYSAREIAATLGISAKTVDRHRTNTLAKLGLRDRLALLATRSGPV